MIGVQIVAFLKGFWAEFVGAAKQAPAIYFAPVKGACKAVQELNKKL